MIQVCKILRSILLFVSVLSASGQAFGYTPDKHERAVILGAQQCKADGGAEIAEQDLKAIVEGARAPDDLGLSFFQMFKQRLEPGSWGKRRDVLPIRIAAQSIHGSPSPTRPAYRNTAVDQQFKAQSRRTPEKHLLPDRTDLEVYAYDTNQQLRNKLLINASQFLCVSFAHKDKTQSAWKFGTMLHMLGDTYSASHVQRSAPTGSSQNCGTEKIEWHFSMDLVSWKQHSAADRQDDDWRFNCLVEHTAKLVDLWANGRDAVVRRAGAAAKLARANAHVKRTIRFLCSSVLREDKSVLSKPAGGAAVGYSSASGTDNWEFFRQNRTAQPIQPTGLTGAAEAEAYREAVNAKLDGDSSHAEYWYPSRDMADLCDGIARAGPMPAALQCMPQEIDWAMHVSDRVATMWLPARELQ